MFGPPQTETATAPPKAIISAHDTNSARFTHLSTIAYVAIRDSTAEFQMDKPGCIAFTSPFAFSRI